MVRNLCASSVIEMTRTQIRLGLLSNLYTQYYPCTFHPRCSCVLGFLCVCRPHAWDLCVLSLFFGVCLLANIVKKLRVCWPSQSLIADQFGFASSYSLDGELGRAKTASPALILSGFIIPQQRHVVLLVSSPRLP